MNTSDNLVESSVAGSMFADDQAKFPACYFESHWYAVYVCANHENRVAEQFGYRSVEHFLPRYESLRRWKDRRIRLSLPLFPGYLFVRLALRDRLQVLRVPSVVRLVEFNGIPAPLPNGEIEILQRGLAQGIYAKPRPYLTVGREVPAWCAEMDLSKVCRRNSAKEEKLCTRGVISIESHPPVHICGD